jgi:NADH:ubiquinone oxidoreductase subunit 6 (subunit J)
VFAIEPTAAFLRCNLRLSYKRIGLFSLASILMSRSTANADDGVAEATNEATTVATEKLNAAKAELVSAFNGDTDAMLALFTQYLLPVALAAVVIFVGYVVAGFIGEKASRR